MDDSIDAAAHAPTRPDADPRDDQGTRNRLLREGLKLFIHSGFASVSTRQICVAAGVTQPSLYHHFGSKEGLYLAAIETWFTDLHAGMTHAIAQGTSFRARLHHLAIFFWSGQAGEYQAMQHDALQHMPQTHLAALRVTIFNAVVAPLLALMVEGQSSGELPAHANPYALMELYWAIVDGFTGIYHRGDMLPSPEQNIAAIDLFLAGVRALTPEALAPWPSPNIFASFLRELDLPQ